MATHDLGPPGVRRRRLLGFAAGAGLVLAAGAAIVLASSDPATFWDRTIEFQADRDAPFSVWGFYGGGWEIAQRFAQAGLIVLAVALAFVPRRDDLSAWRRSAARCSSPSSSRRRTGSTSTSSGSRRWR